MGEGIATSSINAVSNFANKILNLKNFTLVIMKIILDPLEL